MNVRSNKQHQQKLIKNIKHRQQQLRIIKENNKKNIIASNEQKINMEKEEKSNMEKINMEKEAFYFYSQNKNQVNYNNAIIDHKVIKDVN
jgi:hypothetical protein